MWNWLSSIIAIAYRVLWHEMLQRQEPFTYQFRRMLTAHPAVWYWLTVAGGAFGAWLMWHLAGWF